MMSLGFWRRLARSALPPNQGERRGPTPQFHLDHRLPWVSRLSLTLVPDLHSYKGSGRCSLTAPEMPPITLALRPLRSPTVNLVTNIIPHDTLRHSPVLFSLLHFFVTSTSKAPT